MTQPAAFVLVHSPLVGPATWAPAAEALRSAGHPVSVPALTPPRSAPRPWWRSAAGEVVAAVSGMPGGGTAAGPVVLAGHSGAGRVLPAMGEALDRAGRPVAATCFVDALLPADGARPLDGAPPAFARLVDELAVDGLLPPWHEWFRPDALAEAVPDPAARAAVTAELVSVPVSFFDDPVPVPAGWAGDRCAYLSFTYADELAEARRRGWPAAELPGGHLHTVVDPARVAAAMVELVAPWVGGCRP